MAGEGTISSLSTTDMEQTFQNLVNEYGPYLDDARRRLLFVAVFFGAVCIGGFFASPYVIKAVATILSFDTVQYAVFSPFRLLSTSVDIGLFLGIVATIPLILVEVYEFLAPGCTRSERRSFFFYMLVALGLFSLGFAYGLAVLYYAAFAVASFNSVLGLANLWDIGSFISQSLLTSALLGTLFQFPLLLSLGMRWGMVSRSALTKGRKIAIAATVCVVALLPPTDGLSLVVMSVPLIVLYELTLLLARERKRQVVLANRLGAALIN